MAALPALGEPDVALALASDIIMDYQITHFVSSE